MKLNLFSKEKPLHLIYFPVFFVSNHFLSIVTPRDPQLIANYWYWLLNFLGAVIICISISFVIYKALSLKLNGTKPAILAALILFPFFLFQDLFLTVEQWTFGGMRARWVLPIIGGVILHLSYLVIKSNRTLKSITQYLNAVFFCLSAYTIVTAVIILLTDRPKGLTFTPPLKNIKCTDCPDIYLLVLDSYTSNKSLREHFHFDNSYFTDQLTQLGFAVSDQAFSAYTRTEYSLTATLNFDELEDLDQYSRIEESMKTTAVINSLMAGNYEIHNYSIFDIGDEPAYYRLIPETSVGIVNGILGSSILNIIYYDVRLKLKLYEFNTNIIKQLSLKLETSPKRPQFFYAHLMAPHPPFVIDSMGQKISFFSQQRNAANETVYRNEVKGLNQMMLVALNNIVKSSPNSVVIIMGDHGYRYLNGPARDKEAHTVFLAYRGHNKEALDSLSRSNQIFQLVFDDIH